jgi:hypothetical protein
MSVLSSKFQRIPRTARLSVLLLLLIALWNPSLPWREDASDLILLLDESDSMDPTYLDQAWKQAVEVAATLPAGSRFSLVRFAADSVTEVEFSDVS